MGLCTPKIGLYTNILNCEKAEAGKIVLKLIRASLMKRRLSYQM